MGLLTDEKSARVGSHKPGLAMTQFLYALCIAVVLQLTVILAIVMLRYEASFTYLALHLLTYFPF